MDSCDVLIVGGGPAGSSCAWALRASGLDVRILDREAFPRDKVCGGWITPAVLEALEIASGEYGAGRVFQPILGFSTSRMGDPAVETRYPAPVSFGIRRCEFDHYLVARAQARLEEPEPLARLERTGRGWTANGRLSARFVVGAGGHFCPVARFLGATHGSEPIVAARELEIALDNRQRGECAIDPELPELYFCSDLKGYGWCFRKGPVLNVGLGRLDSRQLAGHVTRFLDWLKQTRRIPRDYPESLPGHAYLLYGWSRRTLVRDGILLIGDAAGLAYPQSGEGIRPAVESGLLAGRALLAAAAGDKRALDRYGVELVKRFGRPEIGWPARLAGSLPPGLVEAAGRQLLGTRWFSRRVVLDRWFLHRGQAALA